MVDIHAEDGDLVKEARSAIQKANSSSKVIYIRTDVTKEDQVKAAVEQTVKEFSRIDYAANFAGILGPLGATWETDTDEWKKVIDVNMIGVWLCMKHELAQMVKQDPIVAEHGQDPERQQQRGSIINAASVNSQIAGAGTTGYTGAKHAVLGMTRSAALEGRAMNVRVNCVSPGFLRTKLLEEPLAAQGSFGGEFWQSFETRQGRKATFDEVGDAVVMLSSPRMSLVVGVNLPIDK